MKARLITRNIETFKAATSPYDVRDTELRGFILRILPTGKKVYFCDFRRPDGRRTRVKIGDDGVLTPARARDEAHKILGDLARGQDPAAERRQQKQESLEGFIKKQYQPWVETHRKTGAQTVSRTLARFDDFKTQRLSDISPWKIEKWRSARLKSGISAATVNRNVTMLKAILQKAVQWGILERNPIESVKPLKLDHSAKIRFLSSEEETLLRKALNEREDCLREERRSYNAWCEQRGYPLLPNLDSLTFADYLKPMILLSLNTGMRRGEIFNLNWPDVNFSQRILTVVGTTAKSGKTRHIPLNKEAFETLKSWKEQALIQNILVFPSRSGEKFDNVSTSWETLLKKAGIENFRWHDLRHHFASMLVMNSVDLNTVRELLGHGDLKMTLRYAHLAPQVKANAVAKLDFVRSTFLSRNSTTENSRILQAAEEFEI
jgi:integrase